MDSNSVGWDKAWASRFFKDFPSVILMCSQDGEPPIDYFNDVPDIENAMTKACRVP